MSISQSSLVFPLAYHCVNLSSVSLDVTSSCCCFSCLLGIWWMSCSVQLLACLRLNSLIAHDPPSYHLDWTVMSSACPILSSPSAVHLAYAGFCLSLPSLPCALAGSEWDPHLLSLWFGSTCVLSFQYFFTLISPVLHLQNYISRRGRRVCKNIPWLT